MYGKRIVDKKEEKQASNFKAYNIYPNKDFNYALLNDSSVTFLKENNKVKTNIWNIKYVPYKIVVNAKKVLNWSIQNKRKVNYIDNLYKIPYNYKVKVGKFRFTPKIPKGLKLSKENYEIELIPYGSAKVRITIFPKIKVSDNYVNK